MAKVTHLLGCCAKRTVGLFAGLCLAQVPPHGPPGQADKSIVFIASDFRNGGVMGVYRGLEEAARLLGWQIHLENGQGNASVQADILWRAVKSRVDGVVFGGFDPDDFSDQVAAAQLNKIVMMGWHAGKNPGPTKDLFVNVSTRPEDVAKVAASYVIQDAAANRRQVGVVIFNDDQFAVANVKKNAMVKTIQACEGYQGCKVLSVENVKISNVAAVVPALVARLEESYGRTWTYSLAINDAYFDEINYPLITLKRTDIRHVSAGDGSSKAIGRIQSGVSQQVATVAEPLRLQGFQLADEFNRAFSGVAPSGFQSVPVLVTAESLRRSGTSAMDASQHVEDAFSSIWKRK